MTDVSASAKGATAPKQTVVIRRSSGFSLLSEPVTILVNGAPGAGKNMLFESWATSDRGAAFPTERSETPDDINYVVKRSRRFWFPERKKIALTVIPGQEKQPKVQALNDRLRHGHTTVGAIHVVCWGYNTIWQPGEDSVLVREALRASEQSDPAKVPAVQLEYVRQQQLKLELADLRKTLAWLKASWTTNRPGSTPRFFVLALNKADLYWSRIDEAKAYYRALDGNLLDTFSRKVDVEVEILPVSAAPLDWEPEPPLRCVKESEISEEQSGKLMTEFFGRLEAHCGIR